MENLSLKLEVEDGTKDLLKAIAKKSGRSMTKEIQLLLDAHAKADIGLDTFNRMLENRPSQLSFDEYLKNIKKIKNKK